MEWLRADFGHEHRMPVNPIKKALALKQLRERPDIPSNADLARHLGISQARVTQTLNLLKLAPEILDTLLNLPDDQIHLFSERRLRPIAQTMPPKKQTAALDKMWALI